MKGIVAELNGKYAIILAKDGSFKKIKAVAHMTVGSEIDMNQPAGNAKVIRLMTKISSIAAAALLVMGVSYGAYCYTVPYSYVDIDINPSIEITTNIYDRIIKAEALNDDGKKILNNKNLKNTRLEAGVSQLLNTALKQGYLKARAINSNLTGNETTGDNQTNSGNTSISESEGVIENAVLFTVSSSDGSKSDKLKKQLAALASKELERDSVNSEVLIGIASIEQRNDAKKAGVTPGKLALIEDVMENEPDLKLEELKKAAVKDLIKKAKDKKTNEDKQNANKEKEKITGETSGDAINQNNEATLDDKSVKQEQTNVIEKLTQLLDDLKKNEGTTPNNKSNKQSKSNKVNNGNSASNGNKNDKQIVADILKREKQQREKLKDELLEQMKDFKQVCNGVQKETITQHENESTSRNKVKETEKKDKKDTPQKK